MPTPGLIVLPEVYNINPHIRSAADGYADDGFVVIAPDIYWRREFRQLSAIYTVIAIVDVFTFPRTFFYSMRCEAPGLA